MIFETFSEVRHGENTLWRPHIIPARMVPQYQNLLESKLNLAVESGK